MATGFQRWPSDNGSLRLPGKRSASRDNDLPSWELHTAIRMAHELWSPLSWVLFLTPLVLPQV